MLQNKNKQQIAGKSRLFKKNFVKYRSFQWLLAVAIFISPVLLMPSCKAKEGCGLEEKYNNPDMKSKGGKSNLFSKNQRKKIGRS